MFSKQDGPEMDNFERKKNCFEDIKSRKSSNIFMTFFVVVVFKIVFNIHINYDINRKASV